ncbi:hypothetical protein CFII64_10151 [Pseudomonas sp. CFII64]|nr:hypothetical protein CFII64_10151 [Pseudomonas sp. CFII64]
MFNMLCWPDTAKRCLISHQVVDKQHIYELARTLL